MEIPYCGDDACSEAELLAAASASAQGGSDLEDRVEFMSAIYGSNDFSAGLARNYSARLASAYKLNNKWNRVSRVPGLSLASSRDWRVISRVGLACD